jgi:DNA (cytosine-5)-methyltransferase 1
MCKKDSGLTATDQFCGAGGSTTGAKKAGFDVVMALNHWDLAIETHNTNHPETDHDCTDVQACDPRRYPSTNLLITSPECTNHSLAKGNKRKNLAQFNIWGKNGILPEHERSRATMWDVPRFAEYHNYDAVIVENVVDARNWRMYGAWLMAMEALGYVAQEKFLNSMFFPPCPQSRDRMYVVFTKKGNKRPDLEHRPIAPCPKCGEKEAYQSFKRGRKWGKYKQQYVYRCSSCNEVVTPYYHCAMNIIDWQVPMVRIGDRKAGTRYRPLVKKTMDRIKYGIEKYGQQQMIITTRYSSGIGCRVKTVHDNPFPTQPGDQSHFLLSSRPIFTSTEYGGKVKGAEMPIKTMTTQHSDGVIIPPAIVQLRGTGKAVSSQAPLNSVTAGGINHGLLMSGHSAGWVKTLDNPTGTFVTTTPQALITHESMNSFITYYYGGSNQASNMAEAIATVTTNDRAGLTVPKPKIEDCFYRCLKAHEVQRAMAFEDSYIVLGDVKKKVKQLGNAVTPPVLEWLATRVKESLEF